MTKRIIALSFAALFMFMAISPMFAKAQTTVPGHYKNGPYVDKIVFDVITQDDQQVLALQDDEIDMIDQQIDPTFLDTLVEAENIEVVNVLRNGYGYVSINCAKYPLNVTAFRRAVAFATDKEAISDLLSTISFLECEKYLDTPDKNSLKNKKSLCRIQLENQNTIELTLYKNDRQDNIIGISSMNDYLFSLSESDGSRIDENIEKLLGIEKKEDKENLN